MICCGEDECNGKKKATQWKDRIQWRVKQYDGDEDAEGRRERKRKGDATNGGTFTNIYAD